MGGVFGGSNTRKLWTTKEMKCFLECYLARKEEFMETRKKRLGYQHVLEDMIAHGIADDFTPVCLERKMRTLLSAFKAAKDNNRRTGASPCLPPYMEMMNEIFGDKPIISNNHTATLGFDSYVEDIEVLEELEINIVQTHAELSPTQESPTEESPTQESPTQESPTQQSSTQELQMLELPQPSKFNRKRKSKL
ncbi:uncharacterized protein LOC119677285 [Teleopsis dalmanni]|uniref:uncharacterized protein LOC119677285 n=1 Tax=Teleopsis dalmanni TaxID=139649 RepID=UPI0018CCBED6|nr:uncharacterized protein LOC119677285 [Teleopsis dalmanni]